MFDMAMVNLTRSNRESFTSPGILADSVYKGLHRHPPSRSVLLARLAVVRSIRRLVSL